MQIRSRVDHDRLAAWVEKMKGVFNGAIEAHAAAGRVTVRDIVEVRGHLECLAMIQDLLREHHEMANSIRRDYGRVGLTLSTFATLIKPNGAVIPIKRKGEGHG